MKPTIEKIRALCTESSFQRGAEYFHEGLVSDLEQSGNQITAVVSGTSEYEVTINLDAENIQAYCTCPYDWGGYCKHIVAALMALSENYNKIKKTARSREKSIETILKNVSFAEIKEFLRTEFDKSPSLRDHFTIHFSANGSEEKSIHDYKQQINCLYREAGGRHGFVEYGTDVDFSYISDLADRYIKAGNFIEAITIYQALSESIAENMDMVDDSDGYYGGEFSQALKNFTDCINRAKLDHKAKKPYIDYLFDKYIENEPDYFQENYDCALQEICRTKNDLEYWKNLLEPHVPDSLPDSDQCWASYQAKDILMMQFHILDCLNDKKGFYELIQKYYGNDVRFCLLYINRMEKDGRKEESIKIAEQGLDLFPSHMTKELRRFLNKVYKKHSPDKYKQNLITLFLQDNEWDDYEKLKRLYSGREWEKTLAEIINRLSKDRFGREDTIVEIYLREKMFEKALKHVISREDLYYLSRYRKDLSSRFPGKYFNAYKELITSFAETRTGRPHYKNVVGYLKQMKDIKGFGKKFKDLVEFFRTKYANRPAFLDEMRRL